MRAVIAASVWFNNFARSATPHPNNHAAGHQRIRQPAEACERNGTEGGTLLGSHRVTVNDASPHRGGARHSEGPVSPQRRLDGWLMALRIKSNYLRVECAVIKIHDAVPSAGVFV